MNRRTALKAIGTALLAPIVKLRPTVDREKLLRAFCGDSVWSRGDRYDLDQPFGLGSLTYASDTRHIVRAELSNRIEDGTRKILDVQECWDKFWHPYRFVPFELPAHDSPLLVSPHTYGVCPLCDDRRISFGDRYPTEEEHETLIDWDYDNTHRDPSCPLCHGRWFMGPCNLDVCGVRMSYSRLKPLVALPNLRVAGNRLGNPDGPLVFAADGFEGMAMGLLPINEGKN